MEITVELTKGIEGYDEFIDLETVEDYIKTVIEDEYTNERDVYMSLLLTNLSNLWHLLNFGIIFRYINRIKINYQKNLWIEIFYFFIYIWTMNTSKRNGDTLFRNKDENVH